MMILAFQLISEKIEMDFQLIGRLQRQQQHTHRYNMSSPAEVQSSIAVQFKAPAHRGECGAIASKITIPFFLMGCCGDQGAVVRSVQIKLPEQINKAFFRKIAKLLEMNSHFDWDWSSFRRNILAPNRAHIQEIFGEFFTKRIMEDLFVVLNNWEGASLEEEMEAQEAGLNLLSHRTFFTEKHVDY
jgi:hypothetical protein